MIVKQAVVLASLMFLAGGRPSVFADRASTTALFTPTLAGR
jgi:hypothetical protein